jgi:hypothetical protein
MKLPTVAGVDDPVIKAYMAAVDQTLIVENLKRSPEERLLALQQLQRFAEELRKGGEELRRERR